MADINQASWSETDASNNAGSPNGWTSGVMTPSQVEPTARAMMGAIKRFYDHVNATISSAGTANAQTLTYAVTPAGYVTGDHYAFIPGNTNTGATTLNINGLGAVGIQIGTNALAGGEIVLGIPALVYYDGLHFQLANPYPGYTDQIVASGSGVVLTSNTPANVLQLSVGPGEFDVTGTLGLVGTGTTTITSLVGDINTTSAALSGIVGHAVKQTWSGPTAIFANGNLELPLPTLRLSLSVSTLVYLVADVVFGTSTCSGYGTLRARRIVP